MHQLHCQPPTTILLSYLPSLHQTTCPRSIFLLQSNECLNFLSKMTPLSFYIYCACFPFDLVLSSLHQLQESLSILFAIFPIDLHCNSKEKGQISFESFQLEDQGSEKVSKSRTLSNQARSRNDPLLKLSQISLLFLIQPKFNEEKFLQSEDVERVLTQNQDLDNFFFPYKIRFFSR